MPLRLSGARRDQASSPPAGRPLALRLLGGVLSLALVVAGEIVTSWSGGVVRADIVVLATLVRESRSTRVRVLAALTALVTSWVLDGVTWSTTASVAIAIVVAYAVARVLTPTSGDLEALPSRRFARKRASPWYLGATSHIVEQRSP